MANSRCITLTTTLISLLKLFPAGATKPLKASPDLTSGKSAATVAIILRQYNSNDLEETTLDNIAEST